MDIKKLTINNARELAELTSRIVDNLATINEDNHDLDYLDYLTELIGNIAVNLQIIANINPGNLDDLLSKTKEIAKNLRAMEDT
jgi:hypothetical protein